MKSGKRQGAICVIVISVAALSACRRHGGKALSSDDQQTLYTLGAMLGRNLGSFRLTPEELEFVEAGFRDVALKGKPDFDVDSYRSKVDALVRKRGREQVAAEMEHGAARLAEAARQPGAVVLPSGLVFRTVTPGTGDTPKPTDRISVQYEARLTDGTVFDSTRKRGGPATFPRNGVTKCWSEGIGQMKVGEKAVLTCPAALAYGDSGRPPTIPGGAAVIYDVELLSVAPPNVPGAPQRPLLGMPIGPPPLPPIAPGTPRP